MGWALRARQILTRALVGVGQRIPPVRALIQDARAWRRAASFVPPGHFYSPIPSPEEVRERAEPLAAARPREMPGIDLNEAGQLALLKRLQIFYRDLPFPRQRVPSRRYFFENRNYSFSDAICLYGMLRYAEPRRVIEVGSGYSSCAILDTNELFFDNRIACTFIEPYPELLVSLLAPGDRERIEIVPRSIQAVGLERFRQLEANDVLFIDSTHVAKLGSDVNYIFGEILPILQPGVYVHVHDIFYPFEYPAAWHRAGRVWTEAYLLRAFLAFNSAYRIALFNTFLQHFHRQEFERQMPLCLENEGGSIWLHRTA